MLQADERTDGKTHKKNSSNHSDMQKTKKWSSLEWTPEKVAAFWDYYASAPLSHQQYFSNLVGEALLSYVRTWIPEIGEVADYGAGPGYMLQHLLTECKRCWALDFSENSLNHLRNSYGGAPKFAGVAKIDEDTRKELKVDTVFCLETMEHLLPDQVDWTAAFLRDILRSGGKVVVSVPNEEQLEKEHVFCAGCNHYFHRWQHMSSWNVERMRAVMEKNGFVTLYCGALSLQRIQSEINLRKRKAEDWFGGIAWQYLLNVIDTRKHVETAWGLIRHFVLRRAKVQRAPEARPNLIYIGEKAK